MGKLSSGPCQKKSILTCADSFKNSDIIFPLFCMHIVPSSINVKLNMKNVYIVIAIIATWMNHVYASEPATVQGEVMTAFDCSKPDKVSSLSVVLGIG